jgi:anthranilate phosphoribosyltransferase
VVGVNHLIPPRVVAEACLILNQRGFTQLERAFFIRGFVDEHQRHGMDELSICPGGTQVAELVNDEILEFTLQAESFGLDPVCAKAISPPEGMSKGEFSLRLLRGEIGGPALDMVLANAALLFVLAGQASTYREGYKMAQGIHKDGLAHQTALAVSEALQVTCS